MTCNFMKLAMCEGTAPYHDQSFMPYFRQFLLRELASSCAVPEITDMEEHELVGHA